jgi:hypothetical protein
MMSVPFGTVLEDVIALHPNKLGLMSLLVDKRATFHVLDLVFPGFDLVATDNSSKQSGDPSGSG